MVYGLCILSTDGGISPRLFCINLFFASKRVHYDQLRLLITNISAKKLSGTFHFRKVCVSLHHQFNRNEREIQNHI